MKNFLILLLISFPFISCKPKNNLEIIWEKKPKSSEQFHSICENVNGNYLIVGKEKNTEYPYHVVRLILIEIDEEGNEVWKKSYTVDGIDGEIILTQKKNKDGHFISFVNHGSEYQKINIFEMDSYGEKIKENVLPLPLSFFSIEGVISTEKNQLIIGGNAVGKDKDLKLGGYILVFDEQLQLNAQNGVFYSNKKINLAFTDFIEVTNNEFLFAGYSNLIEESSKKALITKIDIRGNIIWENEFSFQNNENETGSTTAVSITKCEDGGFIFIGEKNIYAIKINHIGQKSAFLTM